MKFKMLIILSLFLPILFGIKTCAIEDTVGKSVDQLIDESNGIFSQRNVPENPSEARKLWSEKGRINSTLLSSGNNTGLQRTRDSIEISEIQYRNASAMNTAQSPSAQETGISSEPSRAGSWSFELRDNKIRELGLILFQSDDKIFGTGTMNDGNSTLEVSASGSVKGDRMNLDLTFREPISLYRLEIITSGNFASGDYEAFSSEGESWTGMAKGERNMPSK